MQRHHENCGGEYQYRNFVLEQDQETVQCDKEEENLSRSKGIDRAKQRDEHCQDQRKPWHVLDHRLAVGVLKRPLPSEPDGIASVGPRVSEGRGLQPLGKWQVLVVVVGHHIRGEDHGVGKTYDRATESEKKQLGISRRPPATCAVWLQKPRRRRSHRRCPLPGSMNPYTS